MRVFYFITKSEIGGAQIVVERLVSAHAKRGDEVAVMAHPGGWLEEKIRAHGFRFIPNDHLGNGILPGRLVRAARCYLRAVREWKPDIVSCHSSVAGFIGRVALRKQYPVLFTAHGWGFTKGVPLFRKEIVLAAERFAARFADRIICVSAFDRALALSHKVASSPTLEVVHNGTDVGTYQANAAEKEIVTIVFVGRLTAQKDQEALIRGFEALEADVSGRARIIFVGGGIRERQVRARIARSPQALRMTLAGGLSHEETLKAMSCADIFALLSHWEGFPMTIIEALQIGLPVIASDVGGVAEAVDSSVGVLIPHKNGHEALIRGLAKLITDQAYRKNLSEHALARGRQFSTDHMTESTFRIYEKVIRERRRF